MVCAGTAITLKFDDMKKYLLALFFLIANANISFAYITDNPNDPNVKAKCRNGKYSTSTGRGTCSRHGGVERYLTDSKAVIKPKETAPKKDSR